MEKVQALTLRQLKLIQVLGEVHSMQIAASVLNITQSSATKSLQKAEMLFDTELFHRTNKGLIPSRAGLAVIRHAETIGKTIIRANQDVQAIKNGREGELRLGAPNGASRAALQKAIIWYTSKYPDIAVNVKEAASVHLYSLLLDRELDCIVGRRAQPSDIPGVIFQHLYTEIFCLCARAGHPLANRLNIQLADLSDLSWILPPTEMRARQAFDASFVDAGASPPSRFIETIGPQGKQLLLDSDLVGIWPYQAIRAEYLAGQIAILNIALPRTIINIGIALLSGNNQPPFISEFCDYVQQAGAEIEERQTEWRSLFSL